VVSGVGRGMGVLDAVVIVEGKGSFGGERLIVTNGDLLCSSARATRSSQITLRRTYSGTRLVIKSGRCPVTVILRRQLSDGAYEL